MEFDENRDLGPPGCIQHHSASGFCRIFHYRPTGPLKTPWGVCKNEEELELPPGGGRESGGKVAAVGTYGTP